MAYTAITSFMSKILSLSAHLTGDDKEVTEVLYAKLDSLRTLVDATEEIIGEREVLRTLQEQTMEVVQLAESILKSEGKSSCRFLKHVIGNVDSTTKEWMKMKNMYCENNDPKPQSDWSKQGKMAYATITSFMSTISIHLRGDDKEVMEVLYTKLDSLRTLLEETEKGIGDLEELKSLEALTAKVAYTAEDMVESALSDIKGKTICECLQQAIEDVDSIAAEWMKMKNINDVKPRTFDVGDSNSQHVLESKSVMVGYDDELEMMLDHLVRGLGEEKVISLVGMGGMGKTTFATRIFNEPVVMSHFDVRAKVTVSQEYNVRHIYLGLLHYTDSRSEALDGKDEGELADSLQKSLKGRRYLVIVDDIWSTDAWDDIRMCFPFNNNGSRVLLTTRDTEVAEYASLGTPPIQMRLLTFDEFWDLMYLKVFVNECLTPDLRKSGKKLSRNAKGYH